MADILPMLAALECDKTDTTDGAETVSDVCEHAQGYTVERGGVIVMAYALQLAQHKKKTVAWVMAAAGHAPGIDLTAAVLPHIEQQARQAGADQIAIATKRRGLIHKIKLQGYAETGVIMRKAIQ